MHKTHFIISFSLLALSCAVRPPATPDAARASLVVFSRYSADIDSMRGSGSVEFGQNGERASVAFDISWHGDSSFAMEFSLPFGMTMASVRSGRAGKWIVMVADSSFEVLPNRSISIGREFMDYPLSWSEFLSVVTGRLPCLHIFMTTPDSSRIDKNGVQLTWKGQKWDGRVMDISGIIDNKSLHLSEITWRDVKERWSFSAENFKGERAKEYRFVQSNNNYFYVKYHSVDFHSRAGKRTTF